MVTMTEANQNFSKVTRQVDENGSVIILKHNVPSYLVIKFNIAENEAKASDEEVMSVAKRLIEKNRQAFGDTGFFPTVLLFSSGKRVPDSFFNMNLRKRSIYFRPNKRRQNPERSGNTVR